ncbi:MAG TPA: hypothetical protein DCQ31_18835, partial [Bacteroidales bacterium]|nr:hypothetical protein [Bacteroidales bacterium]
MGKNYVCFHRETDTSLVAENIDELFELHHKAVKFLEDYTGIMEPFGDFEFTIIPAFQYSGMEHPGNIYYRDSKLFLPKGATESDIMSRASLIAHETAHLWFGDLVTMRWFSDVWMKEVFANYFAAMIVNPNYPNVNHDLLFMLKHQPLSYGIDRTAGANPIQQPLDNLNFAGTLYGNIIYYKAPIVFKMLHQTAGDSIFKESIRKYLQKYSYGNADWDELIAVFEAHNLPNVGNWSNAWVKEPGMPKVSYLVTDTAIIITNKNSVPNTRLKQQQLEIVLSYKSKVEFKTVTLDKNRLAVPLNSKEKPEYILLNGSGYEYGYFPADSVSKHYFLTNFSLIQSDLQRGIVLLNQYEDFINKQIKKDDYSKFLHQVIKNETSVHLLDVAVNQLKTVCNQFNQPGKVDTAT